jgi:hypothetical protein
MVGIKRREFIAALGGGRRGRSRRAQPVSGEAQSRIPIVITSGAPVDVPQDH